MWDSGVRKALKIAAKDADCDFEGFGLPLVDERTLPFARSAARVPLRPAKSRATRA